MYFAATLTDTWVTSFTYAQIPTAVHEELSNVGMCQAAQLLSACMYIWLGNHSHDDVLYPSR